MAVDFPTSPAVGQVVSGTGISWRWDGAAWVIATGAPSAHGAVAYAQITTDQGGITSSAVDIAGLSVAFTAQAGRRYLVTLHAYTYSTVAGDAMHMRIMNGAVQLASSQAIAAATPGYSVKQTCTVVINPTSTGTVTLKAQAFRSAGSGTITFVGNAGDPSYIMVEDITYEGASPGPDPLAVQVRCWKSANQAIPNASVQGVTFDQEASDPYGFHSSGEPNYFRVPSAQFNGVYLCVATLVWNGSNGGAREGWFTINANLGHRIGLVDVLDVNSNQAFNVTAMIPLTVGQFIEVHVYQNSGTTQNVSGSNGASAQYGGGVSAFYMALLGPGT